jgi:hypothetical protein
MPVQEIALQINQEDIIILDSPGDQQKSKTLNSLSIENKYQSLISDLSKMSKRE